MKRIAVIALLFVFLFNTMGYLVVYRYNRYVLRRDMVALIRSGSFHEKIFILKVLQPEKQPRFHWLKKNEFSWLGSLYDVVTMRKAGDTTFFYCLHDRKEEDLLTDYSLFLKRHNSTANQSHSVLSLLSSLITQALVQQPDFAAVSPGVNFQFAEFRQVFASVCQACTAPPPKTA